MWSAWRRGWGIRGARLRVLALALLPLAVFAYLQALSTDFAALWLEASPYAKELPAEQPAARFPPGPARDAQRVQRQENARLVADIRATARRDARLASALSWLALGLGMAAEWRARHNLRTWPWRTLVSIALLADALWLGPEWLAWAAWLVALAVGLAALDLRLRRPGPLRMLAWATLLLALAGPSLRYGPTLHSLVVTRRARQGVAFGGAGRDTPRVR